MNSRAAIATAAAASLLLAGCGSAPEQTPPSGVDGLLVPTPSADPDDFVDTIDNPFLPLTPGSTWVYKATDGETTTVTVTDETRIVQGVETTVVRDVVTGPDGELLEDTDDWFAQDRAGNVWYFGEDTTEYAEGGRNTTGSWEAGVDGARAGIVMLARPRVGDGYRQELFAGEAEDRATVLAVDTQVTTDRTTYLDVVQTEDATPLEPALLEHKFYARGIGLVYEETVSGGTGAVQLVEYTPGE